MIPKSTNQYIPDFVTSPGESLLDILEEQQMSQAELGRRLGRSEKMISEIINGKAPITPALAGQLELVLGTPARFWNERERQYREYVVRRLQNESFAGESQWSRLFPYQEMTRYSWIQPHQDTASKVRELLLFFGVASVSQWQEWWNDFFSKGQALAFRQSRTYQSELGPTAAWLRQGEREGRAVECEPYSEERFRKVLEEIRQLTTETPGVFQPAVQRLCASAGVAVVFIPELPGMRISGATRWLTSRKALIQLSLRYKSDDHLWFTFFHEAGHILSDGKRSVALEFDSNGEQERPREEVEREEQANRFAADFLIPPAHMKAFVGGVQTGRIKTAEIEMFARRLGIAPGIVVGRLQHDRLVEFTHHNKLKRKLEWSAVDRVP